jgi:hypothetical protein
MSVVSRSRPIFPVQPNFVMCHFRTSPYLSMISPKLLVRAKGYARCGNADSWG